tara:strand:- start:647 stop:1789 length:1143 start_codon:yes stop_codon:yes gene_type:complete
LIWNIPENFRFGFKVEISSDPDSVEYCCDYNSNVYAQKYGGEVVEGVYVLLHDTLPIIQLVRHFIVREKDGTYTDPTFFSDFREYNWFIELKINTYNLYLRSLETEKNINMQETEVMYYVYCYIDPRNNIPFYVGKGSQNRAYAHLKIDESRNKQKTRFANKIAKMKQEGIDPLIVFLAQNITCEQMAYDIEESFQKKYGRLGYEENGVLLNTCIRNSPPSHKGKTYKEIYGDRAEEQRKKRHLKQIKNGGWFGGRKHKESSKLKIKKKSIGDNNGNNSGITKDEYLKLAEEFLDLFSGKINRKKWKWFCEKKEIPVIYKSYRLNTDIITYLVENYKAEKVSEKMYWFHNPVTNEKWRCSDWELKYLEVPKGFIRGRGKF